MTADDLARLEKAFHLEKTSFIRYVVESSEAEPRDDMDRRVQAFYEDWARESARNEAAILELLEANGCTPDSSAYPIEFSQFNYLSPAYLLRHVIPKMKDPIAALSEQAAGLGGWKEARDLVEAIIERETLYLEEAKKLQAERQPKPPKPPRIKGTSASRW